MPEKIRFKITKISEGMNVSDIDASIFNNALKILQDKKENVIITLKEKEIENVLLAFEGKDIEILEETNNQKIYLKNASMLHLSTLFDNHILIRYLLTTHQNNVKTAKPFFHPNERCTLITKKGSSENSTPLHIAAQYSSIDALKELTVNGANTESIDGNGYTAIDLADKKYDMLFSPEQLKKKKQKIDDRRRSLKKSRRINLACIMASGLFLGLVTAALIVAFPPAGFLALLGMTVADAVMVGMLAGLSISVTSLFIGLVSTNSVNEEAIELEMTSRELEKLIQQKNKEIPVVLTKQDTVTSVEQTQEKIENTSDVEKEHLSDYKRLSEKHRPNSKKPIDFAAYEDELNSHNMLSNAS